ncbi:MAG: Hsp70 family protein [Melioribacteraceae bacterium]|nr:Hsp70 family protein [Melioribacteraceae bacterium]MCF8265660.1 Hsp70 family protein [Melioribacteraceae bacterium]
MYRTKIDYGIDLGTTNSAICRMENGEPVIRKTDTLKDTMPSCIGFNKKRSLVCGDKALNMLKSDKLRANISSNNSTYNIFIEFKRSMGSDKQYYSSYMESSYDSEFLSAEVLKKLKSFFTDENTRSAVVTVPANFDIRQKDATQRAAKLAGLSNCELLQEPVAASIAYGLNTKQKSGYWLVFDFGGGTFDAALVKIEEGILKVVDTDGDNYLGGKDLDYAIVDKIILPYFENNYTMDSILGDDGKRQIFRDAMKYYAEEAKIQLSFSETHNILSDLGDIPGEDDDGNEFELDILVTQEDLKRALSPIFQKAIDITLDLVKRNKIEHDSLDTVLLVGGPTYSPIVRNMIEQQIKKPDFSVDPMTVVAQGAALYASTVDLSQEVIDHNSDPTKISLDIGYESTTVEKEAWVTIKCKDESKSLLKEGNIYVEFHRNDKGWSSAKSQISDQGEIIEVNLVENKPNSFDIHVFSEEGNRLECQPNSFTIIQGIGGTDQTAVLAHFIGLEIKDSKKEKLVYSTIKGLEKGATTPAKGVSNDLKTQQQVRPGNINDRIKINLYQGSHGAEGTRAINNELIYSVIVTGDELPSLLPENSDVELTLTTDNSGRPKILELYFPYLEFSLEKSIPEVRNSEVQLDYLKKEIEKGEGELTELENNGLTESDKIYEIRESFTHLKEKLKQNENDFDIKAEVFSKLKKAMKKIDTQINETEWPKIEAELRIEFSRLQKANNDLGNEKTSSIVESFRNQIDDVVRRKDPTLGKELL